MRIAFIEPQKGKKPLMLLRPTLRMIRKELAAINGIANLPPNTYLPYAILDIEGRTEEGDDKPFPPISATSEWHISISFYPIFGDA